MPKAYTISNLLWFTLFNISGILKAMASTKCPLSATENLRWLASVPFSSPLTPRKPLQANRGLSLAIPQGSSRESSSTIDMVISPGEISISILKLGINCSGSICRRVSLLNASLKASIWFSATVKPAAIAWPPNCNKCCWQFPKASKRLKPGILRQEPLPIPSLMLITTVGK